MQTLPRQGQRVYLTGTETAADLMRTGIPRRTAYYAIARGYVGVSRKPHYPQLEGPGGFQVLGNPYYFVKAIVMREVINTSVYIDQSAIEEWTQEGIEECWLRRHAPWVTHFTSYYYATVRGLVRQWIVRYRQEASRLIPLEKRRTI